eukprot:m.17962 g.17962  ORF g.17962 m.17962 type:complete len:495 (-) comp11346_c1_seq1:380-1864(-)
MGDDIYTGVFEMTVPTLKEELRRRGLRITGKKADLQGRLVQAYLEAGRPSADPFSLPVQHQRTKSAPRSRALSYDELERVVGVTSSSRSTGSSAGLPSLAAPSHAPRARTYGYAGPAAPIPPGLNLSASATKGSYSVSASAAAMSKTTAAGKKSQKRPRPASTSAAAMPNINVSNATSGPYLQWEWGQQPGNVPTAWHVFDLELNNRISATYRSGGRIPRTIQIDLETMPFQPRVTFVIDTVTMTFCNSKTNETRRIRQRKDVHSAQQSQPAPPEPKYSALYRLQFRGYQQNLALMVLREPGIDVNNMQSMVMKLQQLIDVEEQRSMDQAMDESKRLHEIESKANRERGKKTRLEMPPVHNPSFNNSALLAQCRLNQKFVAWANSEAMRSSMVDLLGLEERCSKWYPTSSDYFTMVGKEFQEQSVKAGDNTQALQRILSGRLAEVRKAVVSIPSGGHVGGIPKLFRMTTAVADGVTVVQSGASQSQSQETILLE